jgi:hypothetical protein
MLRITYMMCHLHLKTLHLLMGIPILCMDLRSLQSSSFSSNWQFGYRIINMLEDIVGETNTRYNICRCNRLRISISKHNQFFFSTGIPL